jgi:putative inorganic carbon (HCO3(-)) transporter
MRDAVLIATGLGAAAAAAAGLVLRSPGRRVAALAVALGLAVILISIEAWDDERFEHLRDSPAMLAAAVGLMSVLAVGLAALIRRTPGALPLLAVAALPFRIPIEAGDESANLLLPLYVVIAAGVLAGLLEALEDRSGRPGPASEAVRPPDGLPELAALWLPRVLAVSLVLYALQASYTRDLSQAVENLCFFYVPFATLFALLVRVRWTRPLLIGVFCIVVAEALLFALVGFAEFAVRDLLWNPQVEAANVFHPYFRVNSLFWDPNILARYLAVSAVAVVALMLWTRSTRLALVAAAIAVLLLAATGITFSQSGLLALLAGLATLAALRWSARWTLAAAGVGAAAAAALLLLGPGDQSSGREDLVEGGLELAADRPIAGWGSGSFSRRFGTRFGTAEEDATASHTEPITIVAEQGAVGLVAYLVLVATAFAALLAGLAGIVPGLRGAGGRPRDPPPGEDEPASTLAVARAGVLAGFVAMLVHSLLYAAFLTDPITWALIAIGLALVRAPLPTTVPAAERDQPAVAAARA